MAPICPLTMLKRRVSATAPMIMPDAPPFIPLLDPRPLFRHMNGLVKSHWQTACSMARSLLVMAQLPKIVWFWAVHEAIQIMNFIPVEVPTSKMDAEGNLIKLVITAHEPFYEVKPDLQVLFPFGVTNYYHCPSGGWRGKHKKFKCKASTGIAALGSSDNANRLIFSNLDLQ